MRKLVERLIYHKWFYAFLAVVLWVDSATDLQDFLERRRSVDLVSLALSAGAALLLSLIALDLHLRWPTGRK